MSPPCRNGVKIRPSLTSGESFGSDLDRLRHHRVAARERLGRGVCCRGSCGTGFSSIPIERLARYPVEDVHPTCLADFGDGLPDSAVNGHIQQDRPDCRVVIPDVVVHLLKVPAIFSGLDLDRHASTRRTDCRRRGSCRCSPARRCPSRSRCRPSSGSTAGVCQTEAPPYFHDSLSFGHVS